MKNEKQLTQYQTDQSRELLWKQLRNRARRQAVLFGILAVTTLNCLVYAYVETESNRIVVAAYETKIVRAEQEAIHLRNKADQCDQELKQALAELERCPTAKK